MEGSVLVLDVGTTGVKAIVFSGDRVLHKAYKKLSKSVEKGGVVEQDPFELLSASLTVMREAIDFADRQGSTLASCGLTNQRETTIIWDSNTGKPIHPAIVWEDTRTSAFCKGFSDDERKRVRELTGLSIDPYFSATKIRWLLDQYSGDVDQLQFGTVDTWLMWNMLEGAPHLTDITNASRTLLFDVIRRDWSAELLELFGVPKTLLPRVLLSHEFFGALRHDLLHTSIPMRAVMGDQESSMFAAGHERGVTKITYGTGTFVGQIIGESFALHDRFFTTPTADTTSRFMIESKIDCCGNRVDPVVGDPKKFNPIIDELTNEIMHYLDALPYKPNRIIVDGGLIRTPYTYQALARATGLEILPQEPYDGTALGVARMLAGARA